MMIRSDEDSLRRMLGVEPDGFPSSVLAEYELRIQMFHSDGNSGPLGTLGIIDMLRSMKLGPPRRRVSDVPLDWSKVPIDGSVRVEVKEYEDADGEVKWITGSYVGQVGVGKLAVRLDGADWINEYPRKDVRMKREDPPEAYIADPGQSEEGLDQDIDHLLSVAQQGDKVWVEEEGDYRRGEFGSYVGGMVAVKVDGEESYRSVPASIVACMSPTT